LKNGGEMKFTNEYIEMVSMAEEIQKAWNPKVGDWILDYYFNPLLISDKKTIKDGINKDVLRWLPTLEDLFRLCNKENLSKILYMLGYDSRIIEDLEDLYNTILDLVMLYNYNKSWNPAKKQWEAIE